jgi:hypothetical protein
MEGIDSSKYSSINELVADLEKLIRQRIAESDFPQAVLNLVQRKLEKVLKYIAEVYNGDRSVAETRDFLIHEGYFDKIGVIDWPATYYPVIGYYQRGTYG